MVDLSTLVSSLLCFFSFYYAFFGGVFTLYGDDSLTDVLNMAIKLLAAIPENGEGIVKYSKLASSYFNFMEVLAAQHIPFISNLPADAFVFIVETLLVGINSISELPYPYSTPTMQTLAG